MPHLGLEAARLYGYALEHPRINPDEIPPQLGLSPEAVRRAFAELLELRLLRSTDEVAPCSQLNRVSGDGGSGSSDGASGSAGLRDRTYVAGSPESAATQLLSPIEHELRLQQQEVDRVRTELQGLLPLYRESEELRQDRPAVEVLPDLEAVLPTIIQLTTDCRREVLTSQPGGGRSPAQLEEAISRTEEALRRGVQIRTIYQHTARFSQPTIAYVERVARLGAEVRTTSGGLERMIVFDREAAVLSLRGRQLGAVLVRDPSVVDFAAATFERAWSTATPFPTSYLRDELHALSGEIKQDIIHLLINGLDDRAIARRLGMALRTCQRHTSEIMEQLGARSRLQAGYLLHRMAQESAQRGTDSVVEPH